MGEPRRREKVAARIVAERSGVNAVSRALWDGLIRFNREQAGPLRYKRTVLSARDAKGKLLGGYWRESYIELLWLSLSARGKDIGSALIQEAERIARRRGCRLIHLNTYSFQAPAFYAKQGYRRFGHMSGSPRKASRFFYMKEVG